MNIIKIVDTTLRDGEQTPGVAFSIEEKKHIAKLLDDLGVSIIEAGTPTMGYEEIKAINEICSMNLNANILTWNRMLIKDIEKSLETGCPNAHITVPASDIHIQRKLQMTRNEVIETMRKTINYAIKKGLTVSVGAEDASRTDFDFLINLYKEAKKEGATRIRYADTVGILNPFTSCNIIKKIRTIIDLPIDFHAHNDFGLATANALGAFKGGANYISCSINGLGERAGNTSLEEIVAVLEIMEGFTTNINLKDLKMISKIVEQYSGRLLHKGKPIVGDEVFSHESGIHVDGLLKDSKTYEAFKPDLVGGKRKFVIGKHSGKSAIRFLNNNACYSIN